MTKKKYLRTATVALLGSFALLANVYANDEGGEGGEEEGPASPIQPSEVQVVLVSEKEDDFLVFTAPEACPAPSADDTACPPWVECDAQGSTEVTTPIYEWKVTNVVVKDDEKTNADLKILKEESAEGTVKVKKTQYWKDQTHPTPQVVATYPEGATISDSGEGWSAEVPVNIVEGSVEKVWSEQYDDRKNVNYFTKTSLHVGDGTREYMMLGECSDGDAYAGAQLSFSPNNQDVRDALAVRFAVWNGSDLEIVGTGTIGEDMVASLSLTDQVAEPYVVALGIDEDADDWLKEEKGEIEDVSNYSIHMVSIEDYDASFATLTTFSTAVATQFPYAAEQINAFLLCQAHAKADYSEQDTITATKPTHAVGALFDENGTASIRQSVFNNENSICNRIKHAVGFDATIDKILNEHRQEVRSHTFTSDEPRTFVWQISEQVDFSELWDWDMFGTFGSARVTGTLTVVVESDYSVRTIDIVGNLRDVYDWDVEVNKPSAFVQTGFNTMGSGGEIFRTNVRLFGAIDDRFYMF